MKTTIQDVILGLTLLALIVGLGFVRSLIHHANPHYYSTRQEAGK